MNREIKFRAWDKSKKEMIYDAIEYELRAISLEHKVIQDIVIGFNDNEHLHFDIMQFTGLNDKNGKEIYEGDVLRNSRGDWGVVVFKAPFFEVTVSENQSSLYSREYFSESEVIGNIHENPELLTIT